MGVDQGEQTVRLTELFQQDQNPPPDPPAGDDGGGDDPPYGTEMPYVQCGHCDFYVQGWNEDNNGYIFRSHPCSVLGGKGSEFDGSAVGGVVLLVVLLVVAGSVLGPIIWDWFVQL